MILKNAKIFHKGLIKKGNILIRGKIISSILFGYSEDKIEILRQKNSSNEELDCLGKYILPGIIDIHAHLRDMGQSDKETFRTGTKAAAYSGITTVLNMPNTVPPSISKESISAWKEKAKDNIFCNVGFIAGVPSNLTHENIEEILNLGVFGFKIYPLNSLNGIDWTNKTNLKRLFEFSSEFHFPIFIHPDWPISLKKRREQYLETLEHGQTVLEAHDNAYPPKNEVKFIDYAINTVIEFIKQNDISPQEYPKIHFCHVSTKESYQRISDAIETNPGINLSFELTPHHFLLHNKINLENPHWGKVLPPLRDKNHSEYLFSQLDAGNIPLIGTDHAPHTIEEKNNSYFDAPSGFPGFETYLSMILDKVAHYSLSLERFVSVASINPAKVFNLEGRGQIKEGYYADLVIVDKIDEFTINSANFISKAKYSPFNMHRSVIQIWKTFVNGKEIILDDDNTYGEILRFVPLRDDSKK